MYIMIWVRQKNSKIKTASFLSPHVEFKCQSKTCFSLPRIMLNVKYIMHFHLQKQPHKFSFKSANDKMLRFCTGFWRFYHFHVSLQHWQIWRDFLQNRWCIQAEGWRDRAVYLQFGYNELRLCCSLSSASSCFFVALPEQLSSSWFYWVAHVRRVKRDRRSLINCCSLSVKLPVSTPF